MISKFSIIASALLLLTGCVANDGPTDIGGRSLKLEKQGGFQPAESRFNTFAFLKPSTQYLTQSTERNNGQGWMETIIWDSGHSFIEIEFINTAWFSLATEDRMLEVESFKKVADRFNIPPNTFVQIDRVSPRTKGWIASTGKCDVGRFAKRFKGLTPYDNDRGYSDAVVSLGHCGGDLTVSAEILAQQIDLMSDTAEKQISAAYARVGSLKEPKKPEAPKELTKLSGSWKGISEQIDGTASRKGSAQYDFAFTAARTDCSGTAVTSKSSNITGTWSLTCDDGKTADGIWINREAQDFIASGADSEKQAILFKLLP